jgi:hypothetical protein
MIKNYEIFRWYSTPHCVFDPDFISISFFIHSLQCKFLKLMRIFLEIHAPLSHLSVALRLLLCCGAAYIYKDRKSGYAFVVKLLPLYDLF